MIGCFRTKFDTNLGTPSMITYLQQRVWMSQHPLFCFSWFLRLKIPRTHKEQSPLEVKEVTKAAGQTHWLRANFSSPLLFNPRDNFALVPWFIAEGFKVEHGLHSSDWLSCCWEKTKTHRSGVFLCSCCSAEPQVQPSLLNGTHTLAVCCCCWGFFFFIHFFWEQRHKCFLAGFSWCGQLERVKEFPKTLNLFGF